MPTNKPSADKRSPTPARFPTKFRLRYSRSKAGCLTCRQRKKKCDETRPRCTSCDKSRLRCKWPEDKFTESPDAAAEGETRPVASCPGPVALAVGYGRARTASVHHAPYIPDGNRACGLTIVSSQLLDHYIMETAALLTTGTLERNPFLTCILPQAQCDPTLMHVVLATSGAHLSYKLGDGMEAFTTEASMRKHYSHVVRGLQKEIAWCNMKDRGSVNRVLLILIFLCHYEVLAGSPSVALSMHLKAIGQLLLAVCNGKVPPKASPTDMLDTDETFELALEVFLYLTLTNTICPPPMFDSADAASAQILGRKPQLQTYFATEGPIFAGCRELFEIIPRAKKLHTWRLAEEIAGTTGPSPAFELALRDMYNTIGEWRIREDGILRAITDGSDFYDCQAISEIPPRSMAAECVRHALYIYALDSLSGASAAPSPSLRQSVQGHVEIIMQYAMKLEGSPASSNTLWAILVAGTCLEDDGRRRVVAEGLRNSRFRLRQLRLVRLALEALWNDADPRAWGPSGLAYVVQKHGLSISIL